MHIELPGPRRGCSSPGPAGVEFVSAPRTESYGRIAVFLDVAGNRWDLLGQVDADPTIG